MASASTQELRAALEELARAHGASEKDLRAALDGVVVGDEPGSPPEAFDRAIAEHWQDSVDRLPIIALGLDRQGDVRYANQYFYSLTGFAPEDVLGVHWFERFLPEGERADVRSAFEEILEKEFHRTYENPIVNARGEPLPVRWLNVRLRAPDGRIAGTFSLGQDVPRLTRRSSESVPVGTEPILSMCAWCKDIRDESGDWGSLAAYLVRASGRSVSHGLCPDCFADMRGKRPSS